MWRCKYPYISRSSSSTAFVGSSLSSSSPSTSPPISVFPSFHPRCLHYLSFPSSIDPFVSSIFPSPLFHFRIPSISSWWAGFLPPATSQATYWIDSRPSDLVSSAFRSDLVLGTLHSPLSCSSSLPLPFFPLQPSSSRPKYPTWSLWRATYLPTYLH